MPPVRFSDIGGLESTIARLRECVEWPLVHREKLARLGVRAPNGVLLCGPPGCSKTVLVRATAAESGVEFYRYSRSRGEGNSFFAKLKSPKNC